jgi:hypothetical protein
LDHPQLFAPNWKESDAIGTVPDADGEVLGIVPAVGAGGGLQKACRLWGRIYISINSLIRSCRKERLTFDPVASLSLESEASGLGITGPGERA